MTSQTPGSGTRSRCLSRSWSVSSPPNPPHLEQHWPRESLLSGQVVAKLIHRMHRWKVAGFLWVFGCFFPSRARHSWRTESADMCLRCMLLCKRSKLTDDVSTSGVSCTQFGFKKGQTGDEGPALPSQGSHQRDLGSSGPHSPGPRLAHFTHVRSLDPGRRCIL